MHPKVYFVDLQSRRIFGFLPAYARDSVAPGAPVCLATLRPAQVFDDDLPDGSTGVCQHGHGRALAGAGEGISMLLASQPADTILVRSGTDEDNRELDERIELLSGHLEGCSIPVGRAKLVADPDSALADYARDSFLCTATFGSAMVKALDHDPAAVRHRGVIRSLLSKIDAYRIGGECNPFMLPTSLLDSAGALEKFLAASPGPWILKAARGAGGGQVEIARTRDEARAIWTESADNWGSTIGQPWVEGGLCAFHYVVDPESAEARCAIATRILGDGTAVAGNVWESDAGELTEMAGGKALANVHAKFARAHGGSVFYECQDWFADPWRHLETNPRVGASTPIAIFLARSPSRPQKVRNLIVNVKEPIRAKSLMARLANVLATSRRPDGVLVYSMGDHPFPHVLLLVLGDDAEIEKELALLNLG